MTAPANNATVSGTTSVIATASDNVGVSKVEFYVNGILKATDTASPYTFSWDTTTVANGTCSITAKAYDAANNVGQSSAVTVTINNPVVVPSSYTIWTSTTVPANPADSDNQAIEVGVKFRSDSNGFINGIRFYKASTNTGTHVGNLWTSTGTLLATATFTNETASGWQQVNFSTPVAITANTVYVASYHTNAGHYSDDQNYFAGTGVDSPPLHALADGVSGFNGAYAYGSASSFPNLGWNSSNYWVDVVFALTSPLNNDTTAPTVSITAPANSATVSGTASVTATASDNVGVSKVEFYVNNVLQATDTASPYTFSWNTSSVANGSYTLSAKAYDAANNIGQSSTVTVTVNNPDTTAPTVSITAPANSASVNGTVSVTAMASDNIGVSKVEFYLNSSLLTTSNVAPYSYSWDSTTASNGTHALSAKAYDAAGNVGTSSNVTVTVSNTYTVSASAGSGGAISPAGSSVVNYGGSKTFTITPATGYQVAGVTVDGSSVGAVTSYTFSSVTANHTIAATFASNTYTVSASAGSGGAISPAGSSVVNYGGSQTFTITPATGYQVASVTVDGSSVGAVTSYTFSSVTANHTIAATFASNTYTVSASAGSGGAISPAGSSVVNYGGSKTFTMTPATGYQVAGVTVDGSSVGAVTSYTFSSVTANHTIAATFASNTYTVSASAGSGGAISPAGSSVVNYGGSKSFTMTPATGYHVAGVTVDGSLVGAVTSYTFSNVTANHTIAATFASNTYTVSASAGAAALYPPPVVRW